MIDPDELQRRKYQRTTTPRDDLPECPECGNTALQPRSPGKPAGGEADGTHYCPYCRKGVTP